MPLAKVNPELAALDTCGPVSACLLVTATSLPLPAVVPRDWGTGCYPLHNGCFRVHQRLPGGPAHSCPAAHQGDSKDSNPRVYMCMYTQVQACMHAHMCMQACMHVHTGTRMCALSCITARVPQTPSSCAITFTVSPGGRLWLPGALLCWRFGEGEDARFPQELGPHLQTGASGFGSQRRGAAQGAGARAAQPASAIVTRTRRLRHG